MWMRNSVLTAMALGLAMALGGCYESSDTKFYEPGEYKGPKDPLLEKQRSEKQQERLRQRFNLSQRDR